ncbi:MAG: glutamate--tRNA ligase [Legionellales bacterium RIFCSPHIGHO2_12_FULL_35_11]|nr:MAG: glutamate--tRNA ligase [Legionellales bacterium RIFCSPHIGHO2_12_FULL_35_11]
MQVRTRFAPSPTGYLHVGSVRTAIFSWLFAKKNNGKFILRVEDTDRERSTKESIQTILNGLDWLEIDYDEGPIYQTHRYPRYLQVIEKLLEEGKAYRCTCSKERLEKLRAEQMAAKQKPRYDGLCREKNITLTDENSVVRFKNPSSGHVSFKDAVYGEISVANTELDDLVLLRQDGNPTYNFAVVVDDIDMEISHVIRGDDHINNTPRQINLFQALNAKLPIFAHLPMILGDDGKKLSKRHGAISVLQFKEMGILPHALLNYLVRLGWGLGDQEIFSKEEMISGFSLENISRGAAGFDFSKLTWLNQHYQKSDDPQQVADALAWHFDKRAIDISNGPDLIEIVKAQAERCKNLVDMCDQSLYFYQDEIEYDAKIVQKHITPDALNILNKLSCKLNELSEWGREELQECLTNLAVSENIGFGKIAQPLRVAVTGGSISPSIDITLSLLGREKVLSRLLNISKLV